MSVPPKSVPKKESKHSKPKDLPINPRTGKPFTNAGLKSIEKAMIQTSPGMKDEFLSRAVIKSDIVGLKMALRINNKPNLVIKLTSTDLSSPILHIAASNGASEIVDYLLKHKANPRLLNSKGISALNYAIGKGNRETIDLILLTYPKKQALDPNSVHPLEQLDCALSQGERGVTKAPPLIVAIFNKDVITVKKLVLEHGVNINTKNEKDYTVFHYAARYNIIDLIDVLIELKADINARTDKGQTPIMIAAKVGNFDLVKKLTECQARLDLKDDNELTVHNYACYDNKNNVELLEFLLEKHPIEINENKNRPKHTLLHTAALFNSSKVITFLLKKGANPNLESEDGRTPLMFTIDRACHKALLSLLVYKPCNSVKESVTNKDVSSTNNGVDVNHRSSKNGQTALIEAIVTQYNPTQKKTVDKKIVVDEKETKPEEEENKAKEFDQTIEKMINQLIKAGADLHLSDNSGTSPLVAAAWYGKFSVLKTLLEHAEATKKPFNAEELADALGIDVEKNHFLCVTLLLANGANINFTTPFLKTTPLMIAFSKLTGKDDASFEKMVHLLIKQPIDPHVKNYKGETVLHFAAEHCSNIAPIRILCDNFADPSVLDKKSRNPLMLAAGYNRYETVEYFLKKYKNLNINQQNIHGQTALHYTLIKNGLETAQILIQHGIDYNIKTTTGDTALMYAAQLGDLEILSLLLEQENPEIELNAQNKDGMTALHLAAENGHFECVETLLEEGADPCINSNDGWTVLMRAIKNNANIKLLESLIEYEVDVNAVSKDQYSAISLAEQGDIVQCLRQAGAVGTPVNYYNNRFIAALWANNETEINLMISEGINVNDCITNCPLYLYSHDCNLNIKTQLLKYKLQIDARDYLKSSESKEINDSITPKSSTKFDVTSLNVFINTLQEGCHDILLNGNGRVYLTFKIDEALIESGRPNPISINYNDIIALIQNRINRIDAKPNSKALQQLIQDELYNLYYQYPDGIEDKIRFGIKVLEEQARHNLLSLKNVIQKNSELVGVINANETDSAISLDRVHDEQIKIIGTNFPQLEAKLIAFKQENEKLMSHEAFNLEVIQAAKENLLDRKKIVENYKKKITEALVIQTSIKESLNQCLSIIQNMQTARNNNTAAISQQAIKSKKSKRKTKSKTTQADLLSLINTSNADIRSTTIGNATNNTINSPATMDITSITTIKNSTTIAETPVVDLNQSASSGSDNKSTNEASEVTSNQSIIVERKIEEIAHSPQERREGVQSLVTSPDTQKLEQLIYAERPIKKYKLNVFDEVGFKLNRLDTPYYFNLAAQKFPDNGASEDPIFKSFAIEAGLIHVLESCRGLDNEGLIRARTALLRNNAAVKEHFPIEERIQLMTRICVNWNDQINIQMVNDNEGICLESVDADKFLFTLSQDNFKPPKFNLKNQLNIIDEALEELRYCEEYVNKHGKIACEDEQIKLAIGRCRCKLGTAMSDIRKASRADNSKKQDGTVVRQNFFSHLNPHEIAAALVKFNELNPLYGQDIHFARNFRHNNNWKPEVTSLIREWLSRAEAYKMSAGAYSSSTLPIPAAMLSYGTHSPLSSGTVSEPKLENKEFRYLYT